MNLLKLVEQLLDDYLSDPYLRLHTGQPVRHVGGIPRNAGGNPLVVPAAEDCLLPMPPGVRVVTMYWPTVGSPTDGIQGYYATSSTWRGNPNGRAYDSETSSYTGAPVASGETITFDLHAEAGEIHVASPQAGSKVYVGFLA